MLLTRDRMIGIVVILCSVMLYTHIYVYPPEARLFPQLILVLTGLLGVLLVFRRRRSEDEQAPVIASYRNFFITVIVFAVFAWAVGIFGYFTASLCFLILFPIILGYRKYMVTILTAVIYLVLIYLVFVILFERILPPEILLTRFS